MKRSVLTALGTVVFLLLAGPTAGAEFQGTDVLSNIGPESQLGGGFSEKYPVSYFTLDYYVDAGITDMDGVPAMIAQWASAQLWEATRFFLKITIDLFAWAFSLDLVNGSNGALGPVSDAITTVHTRILGEEWMLVAIAAVGIWGIHKALVQQRYSDTMTGLAVSLTCALVGFFFIYQPQATIGQASKWANSMSLAFLGVASQGNLNSPQAAKRDVADHLFKTQVFAPWVVMQFGGLEHCVDLNRKNEDGYPRPVAPRTRGATCMDNTTYALRYLRYPGGSEQRAKEYEAIKDGKAPDEPQFSGVSYTKADSPAVDIQQQGGAFQRLTVAMVVFLGATGTVALVGFIALAIILAQVIALVLLAFAPVALLVGIFPKGHRLFGAWLASCGTALFIKALYSLVLGVLIAVSMALASATASLGFLFAFALQAVFFWTVFLSRKRLRGNLQEHMVSVDVKTKHKRQLGHAADTVAAAAFYPVRTLAGRAIPGRDGEKGQDGGVQQSATASTQDTHHEEHKQTTPAREEAPVPATPTAPIAPSSRTIFNITPNGHNVEPFQDTLKRERKQPTASSIEDRFEPDRDPAPPADFKKALEQERVKQKADA